VLASLICKVMSDKQEEQQASQPPPPPPGMEQVGSIYVPENRGPGYKHTMSIVDAERGRAPINPAVRKEYEEAPRVPGGEEQRGNQPGGTGYHPS
jgi:hypothetical protein